MKGDTPLDYAEFQFSRSRTRCELVVSGEGVIEKLASGFLKPFLTHLRAAEEQFERGFRPIRLVPRFGFTERNDRTWFTKGTMERFVRFVSTPEILERVRSIEDELSQLQNVRDIQASTLTQTEDRLLSINGAVTVIDARTLTPMHQERHLAVTTSRRHSFDFGDDGAEASKRQLLRAMDAHLIALQQEQTVAFNRAAAAGFVSDNMADLMAFAEHFGARRLCEACLQFMAVFKRRQIANSDPEERGSPIDEASSDSDMSLASAAGGDLPGEFDVTSKASHEAWFDAQDGNLDSDAGEDSSSLGIRANEGAGAIVDFYSKDGGSLKAQEKWVQQQNFQPDCPHPGTLVEVNTEPFCINHSSCQSSRGISHGAPIYTKRHSSLSNSNVTFDMPSIQGDCSVKNGQQCSEGPAKEGIFHCWLQQAAQKVEAQRTDGVRDGRQLSALAFSHKDEVHAELNDSLVNGYVWHESAWNPPRSASSSSRLRLGDCSHLCCNKDAQSHVEANESCAQRLGQLDIQVYNCSSKEPSSVSNEGSESNSIDNEDNIFDNQGNNGALNISAMEPVGRLSVQDAISMFENKKSVTTEALAKSSLRRENVIGSMESGNSSVVEKSALGRWGGENEDDYECGKHQEEDIVPVNQRIKCKIKQDFLQGKNAKFSANVNNADLSEVPTERQHVHIVGQHEFLKEPFYGNLPLTIENTYLQTQQNLTANAHATLETCGRELLVEQNQLVGSNLLDTPESDWQKQFKIELKNGLAREVKDKVLSTVSPLRPREDYSDAKNRHNKGIPTGLIEKGQSGMCHDLSCGAVTLVQQERLNQFNEIPKQHLHLMRDTSVVATTQDFSNRERQIVSHSDLDVFAHKEVHPYAFKEVNKKDDESFSVVDCDNFPMKTEQNIGQQSLGSSWNATLEFNMQALANIADHQNYNRTSFGDGESRGTEKGRFYEQYSKLRDAKLREEHAFKKAEREAKLKALGETLERRKAELEARTAMLSRKSNPLIQTQLHNEKFAALRTSFSSIKKEQDGENEESMDYEQYLIQTQNQINAHSNPSSPPTPHASKDPVPISRPQSIKRTIPAVQKSVSMPRGSGHVAVSLSQSTPKNLIGITSGQRRTAIALDQTSIADNPLVRSVPSFTDLRKENTKPSPGRTSGFRVLSKNNSNSGNLRMATEPSPMKANGNAAAVARSGSSKEDKKQIRKSFATISELKAMLAQGQEGMTLARSVHKEETLEPAVYNKGRQNAAPSIQESKPFLRKGHGIGPGAGPGIMKLKASASGDATKNSDEEASSTLTLNPESSDSGDLKENALERAVPASAEIVDNFEVVSSECNTLMDPVGVHAFGMQLPPQERSKTALLDGLMEGTSDNGRTCHSISFPTDSIHHKQEERTGTSDSGRGDTSVVSSSSRARSLPHEHPTSAFSTAAASPSNSSMLQSATASDHFILRSTMALDSPCGSPGSWNSQIQYVQGSDIVRSRKSWGGYPKLVMIATQQPPAKEPAKGFKRLLKFGRKSRASETATTDWVSASTTSEGDDDPDDSRDFGNQSADDLLRQTRIQERSIDFGNTTGMVDPGVFQEQVTGQSLKSSIPAPPANFKLREDHLSGGTLLKAPRSFFSLPSFRSKGNEGKSR